MSLKDGEKITDSFINSLGEREIIDYEIVKYLGKGGFAEVFELI